MLETMSTKTLINHISAFLANCYITNYSKIKLVLLVNAIKTKLDKP